MKKLIGQFLKSTFINRHRFDRKLHEVDLLCKSFEKNSIRSSSSTCSKTIDRMESNNDSVIICDPTPGKRRTSKRNSQRKTSECQIAIVDNLKDKSVNPLRMPLRTVYESPLSHTMKNFCNKKISPKKNFAAKRSRKDEDSDKHPPKKKPKILDSNETITILSDNESGSSVESREPDIIVVDDLNETKSQNCTNTTPKSKKKRRKSIRILNQKITNTKNSKIASEDDEDIAIVWPPVDNNKNKKVDDTKKNPNLPNEKFFIDTTGDESNLQKHCLFGNPKKSIQEPPFIQLTRLPSKNEKIKTKKKRKAKPKNKTNNQGQTNKTLREIIVDGCNVAFGHSHQDKFSEKGLKLVLDYFRNRGHKVTIFLPQHQRKRGRQKIEDWYRQGHVVFTPSRNIGGKNIVSYDDRFIVDYATKCNGIIVTADQYRDLWQEKPEWRETIEKRLIAPTFVGDYVMFPDDPLGRQGPKLNEFLTH